MNEIVPYEKITKEQFQEKVKTWLHLDSQLKLANEKLKTFRTKKSELNKEICTFMKENNLIDKKIKIGNGELSVYERKEYSSLTYSFVESCLAEIVADQTQVNDIIEYMKSKRTMETVLDIRRTTK